MPRSVEQLATAAVAVATPTRRGKPLLPPTALALKLVSAFCPAQQAVAARAAASTLPRRGRRAASTARRVLYSPAHMLLVLHGAPALQPHLARPLSNLRMSSSPEAGSFELELFSPARLSLFLRVQPRADGLHDVARLSQAVDLGDRLQLARIPNSPSQAAGVVRPSRKTDPIKQHVEFSVKPVGLPGLPTGLSREWPRSGVMARQTRPPRAASPGVGWMCN